MSIASIGAAQSALTVSTHLLKTAMGAEKQYAAALLGSLDPAVGQALDVQA
ncbi:hypothetical protein [Cellulomonas marina]|uniref:Motility protein n=1 Tax=Cellulomonas marina TaxID=988821 RepID=A0A1I1AHF6_9CELL|nr:hypothetical protein [Cellulomonas marina]GIG30779.1 hypothetical protein Cma02nite_33790 [Cellulomonas marina]SFB37434.1 hypothetical protein SAMN05421867_11859 [Cellulomonas marina]